MVEYFEVGQIVNTFGIKGQVKVVPFTDDVERFEELNEVYIEKKNELQLFQIEQVNYHKNMVIIKFKGINTIEEAEKYRNCYLKIDRKHAKKLPKDTYFIADLLGLPVYTDEGKLLGKVDDIYNSGSSDIYVVKDEMGKQVLLPSIPEVLKEIDLENEKIIVHIIEGLL
jgi:16S rRNA processing protein RimM